MEFQKGIEAPVFIMNKEGEKTLVKDKPFFTAETKILLHKCIDDDIKLYNQSTCPLAN